MKSKTINIPVELDAKIRNFCIKQGLPCDGTTLMFLIEEGIKAAHEKIILTGKKSVSVKNSSHL